MEWHEDPIRARETLRAAAWGGAWRMLGALGVPLVLMAILFPAFAQVKYSGPGMNPKRIAFAIVRSHERTGQWAESIDAIRPEIGSVPPLGPYRIAFAQISSGPAGAEYAIQVCDRSESARPIEQWRLTLHDARKTIERPGAFGVVGR